MAGSICNWQVVWIRGRGQLAAGDAFSDAPTGNIIGMVIESMNEPVKVVLMAASVDVSSS